MTATARRRTGSCRAGPELLFVTAEESHQEFRVFGGQIEFENRFFNQHVQRLVGVVFDIGRNPLDGFLNIFTFGHDGCHNLFSS
jgi:hypothetical protein